MENKTNYTQKILFLSLGIFVLLVCSGAMAFGQSAPGGVTSGLNLWLKGDDEYSGDQWKDKSTFGFTFLQPTAANQPTTGVMNFNKAARFDGGDDFLNLSTSLSSFLNGNINNDHTQIVALSSSSSLNLGVSDFDGTCGLSGDIIWNTYGNTWMDTGCNVSQPDYGASTPITPHVSYLNTYTYVNSPGQVYTYRDNIQTGSGNPVSVTSGFTLATIGYGNLGGFYAGDMGEYIVYNRVISDIERQRIDSYLAIRYGVTLGTINTPINYLAADGTTVYWNGDAAYQNNVAGIGRDDATALNQKQSKSQNIGLQPIIGNVDIVDNNANNTHNFTSDTSYLVWGDDAGSTTFATPFYFGNSNYRMTRIWKVQETGTVGMIKVALPVSQISGINNLKLIVSNDTLFDGADNAISMNEESLGGVRYYTATVDLSTGQFFSFAGTVIAPGAVAEVGLWLRADLGNSTEATYFEVPAASRTASSSFTDPSLSPENSTLSSTTSWSALNVAAGEYLTLDLGGIQNVKGVVTKGRGDFGQWVTEYTVSYSTDNISYTDMGKTFKGNIDQNTEVVNLFGPSINARYIRLTVTGFNGRPSMRADVVQAITLANDTDVIANWADQSGNSNNATQPVVSVRPVYLNNSTDNINFNPVLSFNGSQNMHDADGIVGVNTYTDAAAFVVNSTTLASNSAVFIENLGTGGSLDLLIPWGDNIIYWDGAENSRIQAAWGGTLQTPYLWTGWNNSTLTTKTSLRRNGLEIVSGTVLNPYTGNNSSMIFGNGGYNGRIGDIIIYNRPLSDQERNRVESYMAIKFGLTLDQTIVQNYVSSNGAIVWDTSNNNNYNNNIAGIIRDDASLLNQKQSKSVNTGFQPIIGNVTIADTNLNNTNNFATNFSSLLWGSDTESVSFVTPFNFGNSNYRMTRSWKIQETGTVGMVKVALPANQILGNISKPYLVISSDAVFDGNDTRVQMNIESINGEQYYTAITDFVTGQYFTFSAAATAPGGVNTGLVSWYKQNVNNTNTIWRNAINTDDATGTGVYNLDTDLLNFNASYSFNTSGIFTLPATLDLNGSYSVFGVSELKTAGLNGRVFGSALSNVVLGYYSNHMNAIYYDGDPNSVILGTNSVVSSTLDAKQYTYIRDGGPFSFYGNGTAILSGATSGATPFRGTIGGASGENSHVIVPEYITYNSALSPVDQNKVESYLALKYGYTKSGDYISSAGAPFWTTVSNHNNKVAGIGRDDASGLEQKVAKSTDTGTVLTISTDMNFSSPNDELSRVPLNNDNSFVVIGSDNGSAEVRIATDLMSGFNTRIEREWRVQNTNFTQNVNLQFTRPDLNVTDWHVIWDADDDFTSGAIDLGTLNENGQISVPGSQLNTGYFALMTNGDDSDGDGILDLDDLDDDNDGIPDNAECLSVTNLGNWQLNDNAYINNDEIVITDDILGQRGQIWYKNKIDVTQSFNYRFDIFLGDHVGADGVAFAIQTAGDHASGTAGDGIGISGVVPAMVIEFDTYYNVPQIYPGRNDLDGYNHVALESTTSVGFNPHNNNNGSYVRYLNLTDGKYHSVEISYVASSQRLEVYLDENMILQTTTNIATDFLAGATEAYIGFTGSTGAQSNLQKIRNKAFFGSSHGQCDTDNDGILNVLDLDSDNDGCVDALEGDEKVTLNQLVDAGGTVTVGTGSTASNKNICASSSCVDAQGVPLLVNPGNAADIGNDVGQGVGISQNATLNACVDTDGDGIADYIDSDDDNDGILDIDECSSSVGSATFSTSNNSPYSFTAPAADLGFVFDVYTLDNSFNLNINGIHLANNEIQFCTYCPSGGVHNIRFVDGSMYGINGMPEIWQVIGSEATNPTIRIIINPDGSVAMYGSKFSGGPLYPLELFSGTTFNTIFWNTSTDNTVSISQIVDGPTNMSGKGSGYKKGFCDIDNDGISNELDLDSDGDGCFDALEGSGNVESSQLNTDGSINIIANGGINSHGVPNLVGAGGIANSEGEIGQGIGSSQDAAIQPVGCGSCYKPAVTIGNTLDTTFGITALGRAGNNGDNWPMVRKGGWVALEAKTKGLVLNRVPFDGSGNPIGISSSNFVEGMIVYDTTNHLLKIYTTTDNGTTYNWLTVGTPACPE
ncbi:lectin-like domain-containing protein [Chryseobacterium potabilaquae]|uniref:Pesticidal crystal protein Cry22Aa n=1 Tax=Chryseobacterium potabilaquae TaxID=2675057 RepID=A0A6N4XDH6_9FLAO|nr:discoidin domain-containing protein [Chryseobacterium potabilaquae]CAA7197055.1 Pesticidal crystal protein Cry22Aa [Chryseobacterium potabilaquae]